MQKKWVLGLFLILVSLPVSATSAAENPSLANFPVDKTILGNIYVEAWQSLRLDFDTLAHGDVHPAIFSQWLDMCTPSLLRDIAIHGSNSTVVLAAAKRLVGSHVVSIVFFRQLEHRWQDSELKVHFSALRVRHGDVAYISRLTSRLQEDSGAIRVAAAGILALAGRSEGKKVLVEHIKQCGPETETAAKYFARFGSKSDRALLTTLYSTSCPQPFLRFAAGEILFRTLLGHHYQMLLRTDPSEARYRAGKGMYAAWFDLVTYAYEHKIVGASQYSAYLSRFKDVASVWPMEEAAVYKRYVDALNGFFSKIDKKLQSKPSKVRWPIDYQTAVVQLKNGTHSGFEARVSAAISLIVLAERALDAQSNVAESNFSVLNPRGARVTDGNWRTTWRGKSGEEMVVEWVSPVVLKEIWIASGCVGEQRSRIEELEIEIWNNDLDRLVKAPLSTKAQHFQKIQINSRDVKKIVITIKRTTSSESVCIKELRAVEE